MDDALQAQIEPELLGPTPRRIRRRGSRGFGTVFSRFLMVPLLALALFMLIWSLRLSAVRIRGTTVPGQVVDRYIKHDDDGKNLHYLAYNYSVDGRQYSDRDLVDKSVYTRVPAGTRANVQVSPWSPGNDSFLLVPGNDPWEDVRLLGIGSLVMLAGLAAMWWYLIVVPRRLSKVLVWGQPTLGRLVDKSTNYRGKESYGTNYFYYEYEPLVAVPGSRSRREANEAAPSVLRGRQSVRLTEWDDPELGEVFTILYDPKRPERSLMYKYADFEVVS